MHVAHNASSAYYAPRALLFPAWDCDHAGMGKEPKKRAKKGRPNLIGARREAKGWTQDDLAEKVGKAQSTINRYENEGIDIPESALTSIAKALGCTVDELFKESDLVDEITETARRLPKDAQAQVLRIAKTFEPR